MDYLVVHIKITVIGLGAYFYSNRICRNNNYYYKKFCLKEKINFDLNKLMQNEKNYNLRIRS